MFAPGSVLVINGKLAADLDLGAVISAHRSASPATIATMVVREDPNPELWAPIGIRADGTVASIRGKSKTSNRGLRPRMFAGIHILEPALLDRLPHGLSDVIGDAYVPALMDGGRIGTFTMDGYFAEYSTLDRYLSGNLDLLHDPTRLPQAPGPLVGIDPSAIVDRGAEIRPPARIAGGAVVEGGAVVGPLAVVCSGGRVAAGAEIDHAVVWSGATATGRQSGAIVTSSAVFHADAPYPPRR
jgi:NDP-sugar pyrophosphorylase family protein